MSEIQSHFVGIKGLIKNKNGEVLLLKDARRGKWGLPGGRIEKDQSIEDTFKRELKEELPSSQYIELGEVVHVAQGDFLLEDNHKLLLVYYTASVITPKIIKLSSEHEDHAWVNKTTLNNYAVLSGDREAIEAVLYK